MSEPIRSNPSPNSSVSSQAAAQSATPAPATPKPPATENAPSQERIADDAAAELELMSSAHRRRAPRRRRPRRGPTMDPQALSPGRVAENFVQRDENQRFYTAMEPAEHGEILEQLAEKITDGVIDDMQGMFEVFNNITERVNERREARGEDPLPEVELDAQFMRRFVGQGIEHGLDAAAHKVLHVALEAIFGHPSTLQAPPEPGHTLELPDLIDGHPIGEGFYLEHTIRF